MLYLNESTKMLDQHNSDSVKITDDDNDDENDDDDEEIENESETNKVVKGKNFKKPQKRKLNRNQENDSEPANMAKSSGVMRKMSKSNNDSSDSLSNLVKSSKSNENYLDDSNHQESEILIRPQKSN